MTSRKVTGFFDINRMIATFIFLCVLLIICLSFSSKPSAEFIKNDSTGTVSEEKLILLIVDGMGTSQLGLLDMAWEYGRSHGYLPDRDNSYRKALASGKTTLLSVKPFSSIVPDSACAASSLSTGKDCLPETMGHDKNLYPVEIFSEFAKNRSISVGLISDTRLTHATPAAFYGRVFSRTDEEKLAEQFLSSGIDLALSAGTDYFSEKQIKMLTKQGYFIARCINELEESSSVPLLGLFHPTSMPDALTERASDNYPSLLSMTKKGLSLLQNTERYFMMIEAGQIDWASHQNDAGLLLYEMLRFESVLDYLLNYLTEHKDTSLIILSDHETGGFSFSYRSHKKNPLKKGLDYFKTYTPRYDFIDESTLDKLFKQKKSLKEIAHEIENAEKNPHKVRKILLNGLGIVPETYLLAAIMDKNRSKKNYPQCFSKRVHYPYPEPEVQCIIRSSLDSEKGIVWSTGTHTSSLIPLILFGKIKNKEITFPVNLAETGVLIRSFFERHNK
jgi:alkaline phosphatase